MATKDRVLQKLIESKGAMLSGQELAEALGVSRTSIWKAVQALEKSGAQIRTVPRQGYAFEALPQRVTPEALRILLQKPWSDADIEVVPSTSSTNSALKERLDRVGDRAILIAEKQTGGRGRFGRSFFSPRGGLYLSLGFRPTSPGDMRLVTMRAALALHDALLKTAGVETQIKWVNDLLDQERKVAGILTEGIWNLETQTLDAIIVGIGLNLIAPSEGWPEDIEHRAGAIFESEPENFNRNELVAAIVNHFETLGTSTDAEIVDRYRPLCVTLGRNVSYIKDGKTEEGLAVDIREDATLMIEKNGVRFPLPGAEANFS